jgi:capsular polysaccharide transport system permease protein
MSKKMMEGPLSNRQLVYFPQVKFFDVVMSRAIEKILRLLQKTTQAA